MFDLVWKKNLVVRVCFEKKRIEKYKIKKILGGEIIKIIYKKKNKENLKEKIFFFNFLLSGVMKENEKRFSIFQKAPHFFLSFFSLPPPHPSLNIYPKLHTYLIFELNFTPSSTH